MTTVEISRGTTHDGPGLRTTVFAKGCPLACAWCQNPESVSPAQEVWYEAAKCIGCGECVKACPRAALEAGPAGIAILRDRCKGCCACAEACPAKALTPAGTVWSVGDLVKEVTRDIRYYDEFGGGVTVSGGEPLLHADFVAAFFRELKGLGVSTALDTCGYAPESALARALPYTDALLYDIKMMDGAAHAKFTGRGNARILDNLLIAADYIRDAARERGRKISLWIRTPLIPGATATAENIGGIAAFISENILDAADRWELCAFNAACAAKYARMQKAWPYAGVPAMARSDADALREAALLRGIPPDKLIVTGILK